MDIIKAYCMMSLIVKLNLVCHKSLMLSLGRVLMKSQEDIRVKLK